jgi:hypothetical protein
MVDLFDGLDTYLGGPYALTFLTVVMAFILAYILIYYMGKIEDFGVLLIFSGIFVMVANPVGIDRSPLTFFVGVFEVVIGIYLSIKRSEK